MHYWGIDLGGTKIEGAVLESREKPKVLVRQRVATEAHLGYDHILNQVSKLVDQLKAETGLQPVQIGIGHPGTIDPQTGVIKNSNTLALMGKQFDKDLAKKLGVPVRLANDANCFAVAEALMGAVPEKVPDAEVVSRRNSGCDVGGGLVVRYMTDEVLRAVGNFQPDEVAEPLLWSRSAVETIFGLGGIISDGGC
ncbi:MAG: ROK family protein [Lewinellaceae bacterium]|nr:ROK family protein [Lewinellaceae bacterium]